MLILAFDTTSELGGVGIFRDRECLVHVVNDGPANRYSVSLFGMVERAIEETRTRHGVAARGLVDMDLLAVARGPGSFTGIRVGLAAAQGWAKALGLRARGVSVLEALVEAAQIQTDWAVPILDARRGEFYVGLFRRNPGGEAGHPLCYAPASDGWLLRPEEIGPFIKKHLHEGEGITCIVRGHEPAAQAFRADLAESFQWRAVAGTLVESVARLGLCKYQAEKSQISGDLDAYYIRRPDAEMPARLKGLL